MTTNRSKKLAQIICAIPLLLFLFGSNSSIFAKTDESTPPPGGELVISIYASPNQLNPAIQSGLATAIPGAQIFAGLLRFDKDWNPLPYLAEFWEFSDDGLSLTMNIVKNAVFHDGVPITSEDVAFSIMTVKTYHPFNSMLAPIERMETPDPYTIKIFFNKQHPAILLSMSAALLPILPKHVYKSVEKVKDHPANINPIGSGPFKLVSFTPGKEIVLTKNSDFFIEGRPFMDDLIIKLPRNMLEEAMGMETGDTNMMTSFQDLQELYQLRSLDHVIVDKSSYKGIGPIYWLAFNLQKKPFDDVRVRKAIAYSINREFIVSTMFKGESVIETGPISSNSPFYSSEVNLYEPDFELANQLLDEAGYPRDERGKRFSVRLTYLPERGSSTQDLSEYLSQLFLKNLGIVVVLEHPQNLFEWMQKVSNWDFDMTLDDVFNWGDPVIGVHRTYDSSNIKKGVIWSNTQGYINPYIDTLMQQAGSMLDFEKRKILYQEFQTIIMEDVPVYPLFQPFFALAYDKNLGGAGQSIWGLMSPLDTVYWKAAEK